MRFRRETRDQTRDPRHVPAKDLALVHGMKLEIARLEAENDRLRHQHDADLQMILARDREIVRLGARLDFHRIGVPS